jgi:hypothetical protein
MWGRRTLTAEHTLISALQEIAFRSALQEIDCGGPPPELDLPANRPTLERILPLPAPLSSTNPNHSVL